uniref:Copine domain-containing protein n=1 Tax=Heterorhabditis bacteriophora TaxID=37862 RepID=A0A1I7WIM8_HETBA
MSLSANDYLNVFENVDIVRGSDIMDEFARSGYNWGKGGDIPTVTGLRNLNCC